MKEGKTLQELAAELERQQTAKQDFIVSTGVLSMDAHGDGMALNVMGGSVINQYGVGEIAHRQIGQHLKIPAMYYDRMRTIGRKMIHPGGQSPKSFRFGERRKSCDCNRAGRSGSAESWRFVWNLEGSAGHCARLRGCAGCEPHACCSSGTTVLPQLRQTAFGASERLL